MTVYVDPLKAYPKESVQETSQTLEDEWCHMTADSEEELHEFASRLGLQRDWYQNVDGGHYNLRLGKRLQALHLGAQELTMKGTVRKKPSTKREEEPG